MVGDSAPRRPSETVNPRKAGWQRGGRHVHLCRMISRYVWRLFCLLVGVFGLSAPGAFGALTPTHLRCEYRENPAGIGETAPRLGGGLEAAADTRGLPLWLDLRVGTITVPHRGKLRRKRRSRVSLLAGWIISGTTPSQS